MMQKRKEANKGELSCLVLQNYPIEGARELKYLYSNLPRVIGWKLLLRALVPWPFQPILCVGREAFHISGKLALRLRDVGSWKSTGT